MLPNNLKISALIMILAMVGATEGRAHGRSGHNAILAPRRYQYSRSLDPIDLIGEIFTAPIYMNSLMGRSDPSLSRLAVRNTPSYDVSVDSDTGLVELTVELPGVKSEDLDIELVDASLLRIRASRKVKQDGAFTQQEFDQSFQLDRDVDPNHIKASLTNGILTVQATRKEKSIKKIPIRVSEDKEMEAAEMITETTDNKDSEDIVVVENDD